MVCGVLISVTLFNNLAWNEKILSAVSVVALVGLSALRIKQGAVDVNKMRANKEQIIADAIAASDID